MSADSLLNAGAESFGKIIKSDSRFIIPTYQRDYSWEEPHWEDLWNDINANRSVDSKHYMGSIVLIPREKKGFEVIDGQQRMTTLTLVILSAISIIDDMIIKGENVDENELRKNILMDGYIGKKSLSSLTTINKLKLNENNDPFFTTFLLQLRKPHNLRGQLKSNKQLYECFQFFKEKINLDILSEGGMDALIDFVEYISDNLLFIKITATNDLSAFLIFETLNDRGLALSVTDLLKNYIFSIVNEDDRQHIKYLWDSIIHQISYPNFPRFLRHSWMTSRGHIQEKELFKTIKQDVKTPKQAFDLMKELEEMAAVYSALNEPNNSYWEDNNKNKKHVKELELFKISQCFPLLMSAHKYLEPDEFTKVLRICTVISFRYLVISGQNPNAMEKIYTDVAMSISSGTIKRAIDVFDKLKGLYINDEDFVRNFEDKIVKTKRSAKMARYILFAIENHLGSKSLDYESDAGTLEHILPENPSLEWEGSFPIDTQENYIYRIGNFTILESSKNNAIANSSLEEKLPVYQTSKYELSKRFGHKSWNPENIRIRQSYLAKQAKAVWSI
ncbi:DUF262 domain-containing protein [Pantoea sp. DY-5]|uniref:DUF262 domain-containing protein n=1 Tax=Pantoea sp. DY-5 TaxID=2871488 RepID=UPI001C954911|nr:DUF262 domain-containing protein [Pantoea sp. DY-5]MBY4836920.1 DUF262 domain-containing HNH endonuclease family protein [Pantoea sp. DY-5]